MESLCAFIFQNMLTPEEQHLLEKAASQQPEDSPYGTRLHIVLQTAAGLSQAEIAAQLRLPITQVRLWQRAFNRQRLAAFPDALFLPPPLFGPDDPIAEAGRCLLLEMAARIEQYWDAAAAHADTLAVHEIRKAIRQTFTIKRLLAPYFVQGTLVSFRRRWRRVMRRLGRARDITIFLHNLETYLAHPDLPQNERAALHGLHHYWTEKGAAANDDLIHYLNRPKTARLRSDYHKFLHQSGASLIPPQASQETVRLTAPLLIMEKFIAIRRQQHLLRSGTMAEMHWLRIQGKELRYTLRFFAPLMGLPVLTCLQTLGEMQEHLGHLNDARVGLMLLTETPEKVPGGQFYEAVLQAQVNTLRISFMPLWEQFNTQSWRQNLGVALARL